MHGDVDTLPRSVGPPRATPRAGPKAVELRLLGPAFVAAVAYVDPGNFATNFSAGASDGYTLIWVIVVASIIAAVLQHLAARLGAASGRDLSEVCRQQYPRWAVRLLWVQAELVCMATDLAEVAGSALALRMLFGVPLLTGGMLTGCVAFAVLALARKRQARFERLMAAALGALFGAFVLEGCLARLRAGHLLQYGFVPHPAGNSTMLLITGIVGATVMPHAIYIHSSLSRRLYSPGATGNSVLVRSQRGDLVTAMTVAGAGNVAMLAVAAALLHGKSSADVTLDATYRIFNAALPVAARIFAVALLISGLASSGVGTYAGQVIMNGFLRISVPLAVRRLVTIAPALTVLAIGVNPTQALILSQVALSFGVPVAAIPLVLLTCRADVMGDWAVSRRMTVFAGVCVMVITVVNCVFLTRSL